MAKNSWLWVLADAFAFITTMFTTLIIFTLILGA